MGRFYSRRIVQDNSIERFYITITQVREQTKEVEVSRAIFQALDEMEREYWCVKRGEARHTLHLEMVPYGATPQDESSTNPEQILLTRLDATDRAIRTQRAFCQISPTQQIRLLLRHSAGLSIKKIADHEGCSERAVKYSLTSARKNLRKLLAE